MSTLLSFYSSFISNVFKSCSWASPSLLSFRFFLNSSPSPSRWCLVSVNILPLILFASIINVCWLWWRGEKKFFQNYIIFYSRSLSCLLTSFRNLLASLRFVKSSRFLWFNSFKSICNCDTSDIAEIYTFFLIIFLWANIIIPDAIFLFM